MIEDKQVLVVDDEQLILKIISDILSKQGYNVLTAYNCDKALQLLKEHSFDVVLSDIRMPEKDGIDLLEEIRAKNPDIPVILMTGFASLDTAVDAVQNGAFDYLTKPLDYNKLKSVISHAVQRYDLHQENVRLLYELKKLNSNLEQKVKERNRDLENILNSTNESIITTDRELTITTANPRTQDLFEQDCIGLNLRDLLNGINFNSIVPTLLSDPYYSTKHEVKYADKFLEVALSPLIDFESDNIFGIIATTEDITENKKLEAQLIHSAKMSGVGQLAAGVAHEFNNILSGIMGYTSLAATRDDLETVRKDLTVIEKAGTRAVEIINKLLSFSRQKGEVFQVAQIEDAIDDACGLVEHTFETEGVKIVRNFGNVPPISLNLGEIQQVFLNLAINSKHAMPDGGAIAISTKLEDDFVRIDFSDTGHGIPQENLNRIFEPFFTTKKTDASKSGTGLGLSVIYAIIERHDGTIDVTSEPHKGTTFTIKLPNRQSRPSTTETVSVTQIKSANVIQMHRKGNILVVDDEEFIRDIIHDCLTSTGHNVVTCDDGVSAMEEIKKNHFDIVFLDLSMPKKNGFDVLKEIKVIDPNSAVVVISARPDDRITDRVMNEGAISFIKKPFSIDQIQNAVTRVLGAESVSR